MIAYLLQHRRVDGGSPVDLSKFVRHAFSDDELYNYIVCDNGGSTVDVLRKLLSSLLQREPEITTRRVDERDSDIERLLNDYGPGLVTGFKCNRHFENEHGNRYEHKIGYHKFQGTFVEFSKDGHAQEMDKEAIELTLKAYESSHDASCGDQSISQELFASGDENTRSDDSRPRRNRRRKEESHAMVLIGARQDKGKLWFLLQNWWDNMQLVEVEFGYFVKSGAAVSFVCHDKDGSFADVNLESFYSMNDCLVADSNNLDRADYDGSDACFRVPQNDR